MSGLEDGPFVRSAEGHLDFLLRCAWHQEPGEALAAMTPCMRLYRFLGTELARGGVPEHGHSDRINTYTGKAFSELVDRIGSLLDILAEDAREVRSCYRYALRCEVEFSSAALRGGP